MKIFQEFVSYYRTWPLGRQMQTLFILFGSLICIVLIVITKLQLDWLRDKVVSSSEELIENRIIYQMKALAKSQSEYVSSELSSFVASTSELSYIDNIVNGYLYEGKNPFQKGIAFNSKLIHTNLNYSEGAYYSMYELSSEGESQVANESTLNNFYPLMYQNSITGFFQGYEIDEILYFYPKTQRKSDYTPINAEWYYKTENTSNFCITEPYAGDQPGSWVSAFSRAFVQDSEVIRVAALNGSFDHILPQFKKLRILDSGFSLLIGKQGVILNLPEDWDFRSSKTYTRIFDQDITGISSSKWKEISSSQDGSLHQFIDATGVNYKVIKQSVVSNYLDLTHYVLVCIQKDKLRDYAKETNESFSEVYVDLFWTTLAC